MAINSRAKGNKTERIAAKVLAKWTGKKFSRTPSSGGLAWKNSNVKGDVVCTKEGHYFPFCVEVKGYTKIDFSHLLMNIKNCDILDFWSQCVRDARAANKQPLLMMRYNGLPKGFFFICVSKPTSVNIPPLSNLDLKKVLIFWDKDSELPPFNIYPSTEFFRIPYKELKANLKQMKNEIRKTK